MSLPRLLLVDDSDAILAFETACLSGSYSIATAHNGKEALDQLAQRPPDAVLLDLSMPEIDGEEVLRRMRADVRLASIPVIVISSEEARARACLELGADAYLPKPIRADELLVKVDRVMAAAAALRRRGGMAYIPVTVGVIALGLPLSSVRQVCAYPATRSLPTGPAWLCEFAEIYGEPVLVLDLARRLDVEHGATVLERKLIVLERDGEGLALCVDRVDDPEEVAEAGVVMRDAIGGKDHGELSATLIALVLTPHGRLPVIDPAALYDPALLAQLMVDLRALDKAAS